MPVTAASTCSGLVTHGLKQLTNLRNWAERFLIIIRRLLRIWESLPFWASIYTGVTCIRFLFLSFRSLGDNDESEALSKGRETLRYLVILDHSVVSTDYRHQAA